MKANVPTNCTTAAANQSELMEGIKSPKSVKDILPSIFIFRYNRIKMKIIIMIKKKTKGWVRILCYGEGVKMIYQSSGIFTDVWLSD